MDILVHTLSPSHTAALQAAKVATIDRNLAVHTLMLGADESVFALRDLADSYWMAHLIKPEATEDTPEARKDARKRATGQVARLDELRDAMAHIWGRTRTNHALANSDLAPPSGKEPNPRTDKRACGRARRALWLERLAMARNLKFKCLRDQLGWTNEEIVDTPKGRRPLKETKFDTDADDDAYYEWLFKRLNTEVA